MQGDHAALTIFPSIPFGVEGNPYSKELIQIVVHNFIDESRDSYEQILPSSCEIQALPKDSTKHLPDRGSEVAVVDRRDIFRNLMNLIKLEGESKTEWEHLNTTDDDLNATDIEHVVEKLVSKRD